MLITFDTTNLAIIPNTGKKINVENDLKRIGNVFDETFPTHEVVKAPPLDIILTPILNIGCLS